MLRVYYVAVTKFSRNTDISNYDILVTWRKLRRKTLLFRIFSARRIDSLRRWRTGFARCSNLDAPLSASAEDSQACLPVFN